MKRAIVSISAFTILLVMFMSGCNTSEQRAQDAEEAVIEAKEALEAANQEYLDDMAAFREETNRKLIANEQIIDDLKLLAANEKTDLRVEYQRKIGELEAWNNNIRRRLANYNGEGRENWERFKTDFSLDMAELGKALKNFGSYSSR